VLLEKSSVTPAEWLKISDYPVPLTIILDSSVAEYIFLISNNKLTMNNTKAYAAQSATDALAPFSFQRREVQAHDIQIDILYCGVCHSDIHQVRNEWGGSIYPMVPGHEIVGRVLKTGDRVTKFQAGELVGVGCFVDSCRECLQCKAGQEQYCEKGMSPTYNGYEQDGKTPTLGGYSTQIVVDENYVLRVSPNLPLEGVAPLLCAGITTYSPLRHWNVGKGHKIGVLGLVDWDIWE
jgi:uncharacterized zinc-type alcohol dehydrogenase-like protein